MNMENYWIATEERLLPEARYLGELLAQLRGRVSPVLIGDPEWERVVDRARDLPVTMAAFPFGFELPLHEHRPRADFGVSVVGGSRSASFFEEGGRSGDADRSTARIARLLHETAREESPLRRVAGRKMLLEYDIVPAQDGTYPEPGIFLYPEERLLVGDGGRARDLRVAVDALASVAGWGSDAAERRQAERVYLAMKPETTVRAVGVFPSRARALRLAVTGFRTAREVTAFLERAGWPASHAVVASTLSPLEERGAFAYMGVHFDVQAHGVGPRLGLSLFAREAQWLKDIRHWTALIDAMREQRLAVPEKLSARAGSSSGAESLFGKSGAFLLLRGIHHIKLSFA